MNAPVTNLPAESPKRSILVTMATKFGMEPNAFEATVRATCLPPDRDGRIATREEFAAFLLVAKEYNLNPLLKEIYGFRAKNGAIVPVVSVDGWSHIINSNPALDGIEFDDHLDSKGNLSAITARLWRKDRAKPTVVTEYMDECRRDPEKTPWGRWPRRMLRHKSLIQCARYAFGLSGIVDPDEAERMDADVSPMRDVTPRDDGPPAPPPAAAAPVQPIEADPLDIPESLRRNGDNTLATAADVFDGAQWLRDLDGAYSGCEDAASLFEVDQKVFTPTLAKALPPDRKKAAAIREEHFTRVTQVE